jgi:predicted CopG family antitoxin
MSATNIQKDNIKEMIDRLPKDTLSEVTDFITFLIEKKRKRRSFAKRILKIEKESEPLKFKSAKDAMSAVRNWNE